MSTAAASITQTNTASSDSHQKVTSAENQRFLSFSLGEEEYAMPLLGVKEVMAVPETTPIPQSPSYFMGIMNLRGQIISVIDLRKKMNIKPSSRPDTAVIICDFKDSYLGVIVDSVNSVLHPQKDEIKAYPQQNQIDKEKKEYISGVYRKDSHLILFLEISRVLHMEDKKFLK